MCLRGVCNNSNAPSWRIFEVRRTSQCRLQYQCPVISIFLVSKFTIYAWTLCTEFAMLTVIAGDRSHISMCSHMFAPGVRTVNARFIADPRVMNLAHMIPYLIYTCCAMIRRNAM